MTTLVEKLDDLTAIVVFLYPLLVIVFCILVLLLVN